MVPRLKVSEPRQTGKRMGGPSTKRKRKHVRTQATPVTREDRAARSKAASQTPAGRKAPPKLSPSSQAALAAKHVALQQLPAKERPPALKSLCEEFRCHKTYPAKLSKRVLGRQKLAINQGKGAVQNKRMTADKIEEVKHHLKEHAYELTFEELAELSGVSASILCRFFKDEPGWRQAGKSTRPLLEQRHIEARAAWAAANKNNHWNNHVDLDEKWFYVSTTRGRLKLPAGVEKPKRRQKSKRFVAKIMVLTAVARPSKRRRFGGMLGCWRVTETFTYKKKTTFQGQVYHAGDTREKDCTMDGDKFADMLKDLVLPSNSGTHRTGYVSG